MKTENANVQRIFGGQAPSTSQTEGKTSPLPVKMTEAETAAYLGVRVGTLRSWRATGKNGSLRWVKLGRNVQYLLDDVVRFVERQRSTETN